LLFDKLNMTFDKTLISMTCGYGFIHDWLRSLILSNYIKWWSFLEIIGIEMESEW